MGRITETVKVLLIINILFFVGSMSLGDEAYRLFALYFYENPNFEMWQPLTHMFMHGGFTHILFNMYALWAFGGPLEELWGRNKFIFFYFSAGLGAALIHTLVNYYNFQSAYDAMLQAGLSPAEIQNMLSTGQYRTSLLDVMSKDTIENFYASYMTPAVGASGAIYGILVAFAMMFPNVELFLIFVPIPIKAKFFIPVLLLLDLFSGLTGFSIFGQNIANWAHLGGALFGFIMMWYWKKNSFNKNRWY
ncbi:rhomboid family intramembrane serine protease [Planktosalinus lacus]|uniref:Rhomboid family intramembrane serine protease n=1 Tax=Planktosalinus lacus TaxID=1526573 RepID=A0A8J2YAR9_9FLAO|nr:rhomboid family intramembrane serine protease [Planktosalinus lacus]GGD92598.1 rhomboid family intramembrane serine protease [Planktosalinus lacus]